MATVRWLGIKAVRRQLDTMTVSNATAATVYTITHTGSGAVVTYTSVTGDTVDTVAAAIAALMVAYGDVFGELTITATGSGGIITIYGPNDGAGFTITASSSPGGRISTTTTTTPQGPHDANDTTNYSGGALPSAGDTLVFENTAFGPKYNLNALAAIALVRTIRYASFTGQIGLTDISPNGYVEFRSKSLQLDTDYFDADATGGDSPGQFRVIFVSANPTIISVNGSTNGPTGVGFEPFIIEGAVSTSTLAVTGSGVLVCPAANSTCVLTSIVANNATVRVNPTATLTTVLLTSSNGDIGCAATTVTIDRGGQTRIWGSGAYTTISVEEGTLYYQSSGTITTCNIGSGGIYDGSIASAAYTITTMNIRGDGCTVRDPARRINTGMSLVFIATDFDKNDLDFGTGRSWTLAA